jgi:hypothetical protein
MRQQRRAPDTRKLVGCAIVASLVGLAWACHDARVRAHATTFRIPLRSRDVGTPAGRLALTPLDTRIVAGAPDAALSVAEVERFVASAGQPSGAALVGFCPSAGLQRVCALARVDEEVDERRARYWSRADVSVDWQGASWNETHEHPAQRWQVAVDLHLEPVLADGPPAGEADDSGWELELAQRPGDHPLARALWYRGRPFAGD